CALKLARARLRRLEPAIRNPYPEWLDEAYYVVHLSQAKADDGSLLTGPELIARYGRELTQVIRSETQPLAASEQREVLASSISYYSSDLLLVGWLAAIVYDTAEGAVPLRI